MNSISNISINFLALNVRGLNIENKTEFLHDFLLKEKTQICFLQETHLNCINKIEKLEKFFFEFNFFII